MTNKNIYQKLLLMQTELKAPKNQYNAFGKYKYRNCEDILEALKPLMDKQKALLVISDTLVSEGNRFYIKATATLMDLETDKKILVEAYAREEENKKGMDGAQITGAASSYARKYALNGMFAIDDSKDADGTNNRDKNNNDNNNNVQDKSSDKSSDKKYSYEELEKQIKNSKSVKQLNFLYYRIKEQRFDESLEKKLIDLCATIKGEIAC